MYLFDLFFHLRLKALPSCISRASFFKLAYCVRHYFYIDDVCIMIINN